MSSKALFALLIGFIAAVPSAHPSASALASEGWVCEGICIAPNDEFDQARNIINPAKSIDAAAAGVRSQCTGKSDRGYSRALFGTMEVSYPYRHPGGGIESRNFTPWVPHENCYRIESLHNGAEISCSAYCGGLGDQFSEPTYKAVTDADPVLAFSKLLKECVSIDPYSSGAYAAVNINFRFKNGNSDETGRNGSWAKLKTACRARTQ